MNSKINRIGVLAGLLLAAGILLGLTLSLARAQEAIRQLESSALVGTAFTYQGGLNEAGIPANGIYDFQFGLYDSLTIGSQVGVTLTKSISVTNGTFYTSLDFGPGAFDGSSRFLAVHVRPSGGGSYTALTPRQALSPVPYAVFAANTDWGGIANIPGDIADGDDDIYFPPPSHIIWVARFNGDYSTVGDALASISDASWNNRYLIRVAPGIFTETIDLKSYVDIEGSGEDTTILRGLGGVNEPVTGTAGTVTLNASGFITAEVRSLTVESVSSSAYAAAIRTDSVFDSLVFNQVTAIGRYGSSQNFGVINLDGSPVMNNMTIRAEGGIEAYAVYNNGAYPAMTSLDVRASNGSDINVGIVNKNIASPELTNVYAEGSGSGMTNIGIGNEQSIVILDDVTAVGEGGIVSYGIYNVTSSFIDAREAVVTGADSSIFNDGTGTVKFTASYLDGPAYGAICLFSRDSLSRPLDGECQPINNQPLALSVNIGLSEDDVNGTNLIGYSQVTSGDDITFTVDMPFTVTYDRVDYGKIVIGSNGWVMFGEAEINPMTTNTCLPASGPSNPFVAAYWDDLVLGGDGIEYGYQGTAPNRVFYVNYDAQTFSGSYNTDFQIQIHELSGMVNVRYFNLDPGSIGQSATIGFQLAGGSTSQAYPISCNGHVLDDDSDNADAGNEGWSITPVR